MAKLPACCLFFCLLLTVCSCFERGERVGPGGCFEIIGPISEGSTHEELESVSFLQKSKAVVSSKWRQPKLMKHYTKRDFDSDLYSTRQRLTSGSYGAIYLASYTMSDGVTKQVILKRFDSGFDDVSDSGMTMKKEFFIHGAVTANEADTHLARCERAPDVKSDEVGCWVFPYNSTQTVLVLKKYDRDLKAWFAARKSVAARLVASIMAKIFQGMLALKDIGVPGSGIYEGGGIASPCASKVLSCGWVHLDIKWQNILMMGDEPYIHDFGLAEYVTTAVSTRELISAEVEMGKEKVTKRVNVIAGYNPLTWTDGVAFQKKVVTWGYRAPELICDFYDPNADDMSEQTVFHYYKRCRGQIATKIGKMIKKTVYLEYTSSYLPQPYWAIDMYSFGMVLIRLLRIPLFPSDQTPKDMMAALDDFTFFPSLDLNTNGADVSPERVRYLIALLGDWFVDPDLSGNPRTEDGKPALSLGRAQLICLASWMLEADPYRRPSYQLVITILQTILSEDHSKDALVAQAFFTTCYAAIAPSLEKKAPKSEDPEEGEVQNL